MSYLTSHLSVTDSGPTNTVAAAFLYRSSIKQMYGFNIIQDVLVICAVCVIVHNCKEAFKLNTIVRDVATYALKR